MSKNYLFFDIECANCFNNEGKICSFGYALCDSSFNLIENQDLIINPNSTFDPYLFQKNSTCKLSYSKEEFLAQPDFNSFYEKIKDLLENPDNIVLGFGVDNDVEFIVSECIRYHYDIMDFEAYDIHHLAVKLCDQTGGLNTWVESFGIDKSQLQMHRSCDDALATMLVAKELCNKFNLTIDQLLEKSSKPLTTQEAFEAYKKSLYRNLIKARVEYYVKGNVQNLESDVLGGKTFMLLLNKKTDSTVRFEIIKDIVTNGGKITETCTDSCIVLSPSPREKPEWLKKNKNRIMFFDDIYSLIDKNPPRLCAQQPIPADFDYKKARKELHKLKSLVI